MPRFRLTTTFASDAIKLSQDLAKLVNSRRGSDVRFLVGGEDTEAVTMYGHSGILACRSTYFATLFETDNEWREDSGGIIRKPKITPFVLHALLSYIYTGNIETVDHVPLMELLSAAQEFGVEELSIKCQAETMLELEEAVLKRITDEDNSDTDDFADRAETIETQEKRLPFIFVIRTILIPALVLAFDYNLSEFFQKLLEFTLYNFDTILSSTEALTVFLDKIPLHIFKQIISSDLLTLSEYDVWQLAFKWACYKTKLMKSMVESQIKMSAAEEEDDEDEMDRQALVKRTSSYNNGGESSTAAADKTFISNRQLKTLKSTLSPLIPAIRFTLIEHNEYNRIAEILAFFLPTNRFFDLQRFFSQPDRNKTLDLPRANKENRPGDRVLRSKIVNHAAWTNIKSWIYETNEIEGCRSPAELHCKLLYRASIHGFEASVFHQHCDNKGPTVVLVRSFDGHLFGGVNFSSWTSPTSSDYSHSNSNFLFALKDGRHRHYPAMFKIQPQAHGYTIYAATNDRNLGPTFGQGPDPDLCIANLANSTFSKSAMPVTYYGTGASNKALAGQERFLVSDYEVFAISKKLPVTYAF